MVTLRQITAPAGDLLTGLVDLLTDAVHGGASVGFLAPLPPRMAAEYWREVMASLGPGLFLWIAESQGQVVGSVQLAPCRYPNGRHRAEVRKLLVTRACRGQGIATQLMAAVDAFARANGLTLLVLDTIAGSAAESVYRHLGWRKAGEIPQYAASPDGRLEATAHHYKLIAP